MNTWFIVWSVLAITSQPHFGQFKENPRFETKEACQKTLAVEEPRMPDWFRGRNGFAFEVDVQVKGSCEIEGNPA